MSKLNALCGANANSRTLRSALRCGAILLTGLHDEKKDTSFEVSVVVTRGRIELPFQP